MLAIMKNAKHIIWDWNGTLLDDRWLCVESINQALKKRNLPELNDDRYMEVFTFPVQEYYKAVGFDFDKEPFEVAGDEFVDYYGKHFHRVDLHEEAVSALQQIQESGRSQSVLSAGRQDYLNKWTIEHDLTGFFMKVLGIDNHYATGKTIVGKGWMEEMPYDSDEVVMIGDTIHDSEVAKAMNVDCILVTHGHVSRKRLKKTGRVIVDDLSEVKQLLA